MKSKNQESSIESWKALTKYLLDTNICIFFFKGKHRLDKKLQRVGLSNCFISEITLAELIYGAENSADVDRHLHIIQDFQRSIQVIPIYNSLYTYGKEKARLRKAGNLIDDFDLLIAASAKANDLVLVTNNTKHFDRIESLALEDWTKNA